jgi:hypothetical protein
MYYAFVWNGGNEASNKILYGTLGEESVTKPGVYTFVSTTGILVRDAQILSASADNDGSGDFAKPAAGSTCVALFTEDGASCFIVGFAKPATFDDQSDTAPELKNPADNSSAGDRVIRTSGGASFIMKRGGAILIEGGTNTGIILNPTNGRVTVRGNNFLHIADGYRALRGRKEPGSTSPETVHEELYRSSLESPYDRETVSHGDLPDDARKKFVLEEVTVIASQESVTLKTRETYNSDGSWVGEGPKYQWGGPEADEPIVLGNALVDAMNKLMDIVKSLKVNTAWGPSTPPLPPTPIDIEALKSELAGKILSTYLFSTKDPVDL